MAAKNQCQSDARAETHLRQRERREGLGLVRQRGRRRLQPGLPRRLLDVVDGHDPDGEHAAPPPHDHRDRLLVRDALLPSGRHRRRCVAPLVLVALTDTATAALGVGGALGAGHHRLVARRGPALATSEEIRVEGPRAGGLVIDARPRDRLGPRLPRLPQEGGLCPGPPALAVEEVDGVGRVGGVGGGPRVMLIGPQAVQVQEPGEPVQRLPAVHVSQAINTQKHLRLLLQFNTSISVSNNLLYTPVSITHKEKTALSHTHKDTAHAPFSTD